ncbi:MAG TPA: hypothetical protein VEC99_10130 [Clostridia bacterium]|nr:hypothetical protein [Clostridia bacterium]
MNWTDEPATEKQLAYLSQCGYEPDHPLTRTEASYLIRDLREHPERQPTRAENRLREMSGPEAYRLHTEVELARQRSAAENGDKLAQAQARRADFWADTCREVTCMHISSPQMIELYQKQGCRFDTPTHEQVREILDALDSAMPFWDKEHPELFYQALELNFPDLLRHR